MDEIKQFVTIAELSELTNLPNSTCRRYISAFSPFFFTNGGKRGRKYEISAVEVLKRIKKLYDEMYDTNDVHRILSAEYPMYQDTAEGEEEHSMVPANKSAIVTMEDFDQFQQEMKESMKEAIAMMLGQITQQNEEMLQVLQQTFETKLEEELKKQEALYQQQLEAHQQQFEEKLQAELKDRELIQSLRQTMTQQEEQMKELLEKVEEQSQRKKGWFGWFKN